MESLWSKEEIERIKEDITVDQYIEMSQLIKSINALEVDKVYALALVLQIHNKNPQKII